MGIVLPTDDEKPRERSQAVGLFRYQLICPALDAGLSTKPRGRLVREIASRQHTDPFGTRVRYSRDTLDRWIRRYRPGGFEGLIPTTRVGTPRTDTAILELAASLKRENPARTVAQVQRSLRASAGWAPSAEQARPQRPFDQTRADGRMPTPPDTGSHTKSETVAEFEPDTPRRVDSLPTADCQISDCPAPRDDSCRSTEGKAPVLDGHGRIGDHLSNSRRRARGRTFLPGVCHVVV
ncbi:hypothetical protein RW1_005_01590 [Rhodococcus wratislaviensis NBRC 100605]|uniref:Insertion element IS150 protein InsJ-like helix-turn-helix domain-containing protein n=1 Tax=Rhodococcus wratislaviensis NBRC 100605 TaxID=1219028 RepID=X0QWT3_RHOWR|nr:hypothetical protein RW1_005_01590 [Rhodococcus wratislaviensis NBRC 100605]